MATTLTLKQDVFINGVRNTAGSSITVEESFAAQLISENKAIPPAGWNEYPNNNAGGGAFTSISFTTTLPFTGNYEIPQTAVTGALAFTASGTTVGSQINMCLVANGTNVPTFSSSFKEATGSSGYDNTANVKNYYQFLYTNNRVVYSIYQEVGDTGAAEPTAPLQVTGLTLGSATTTTQALTWTAPSNGGSAITDYIVQYSTDNSTWSTFADGTSTSASASVTGLTANTLYYYRVAAVNAIGTGSYSASASGSTAASATAPAQVTGLTLGTPTDTTQPLSWTAPANGGSAITDYLIEYKASSSGTWLTFSDGTSTTASTTVTGLTASTSYDYRVSAINAIGTGTASATGTGSTTSASVTALALLHMETTSFVDSSSSARTVTKVGSGTTGTGKSGFSNCYSNGGGANGYLTIDSDTSLNFGSSNFAVECLVNTSAAAQIQGLITKGSGTSASPANTDWMLCVDTTNKLRFVVSDGSSYVVNLIASSAISVAFGTWIHVVAERVGNVFTLYVNGVAEATATVSVTIPTSTKKVIFGSSGEVANGVTALYWLMDEAVIWNGAKYNGNFTPPTAPY